LSFFDKYLLFFDKYLLFFDKYLLFFDKYLLFFDKYLLFFDNLGSRNCYNMKRDTSYMSGFYDNASKFGKDYFVNSKTSNYKDYCNRKFGLLADTLIDLLGLTSDSSILDFGCASGGLIASLKARGLNKLKGTDISAWAIDYGITNYMLDAELEYFNINLLRERFDVLLLLDVLEHIPDDTIIRTYLNIANASRIVVRLPVSLVEGDPYVLMVSRNDKTHVQCHTKDWWESVFIECGYEIQEYIARDPAIWDTDGVMAVVLNRRYYK